MLLGQVSGIEMLVCHDTGEKLCHMPDGGAKCFL